MAEDPGTLTKSFSGTPLIVPQIVGEDEGDEASVGEDAQEEVEIAL